MASGALSPRIEGLSGAEDSRNESKVDGGNTGDTFDEDVRKVELRGIQGSKRAKSGGP